MHIEEIKERVEQKLQPGEQVEWAGLPLPRNFFPPLDVLTIFLFFWLALAIFATWKYAEQENLALALITTSPFTLSGLAVLITRSIWLRRKALNTVYVITNKRAMTIVEWRSSGITQSYYPDNLKDIYCKEKKDGSGDVIITCQALRESKTNRHLEPLGFLRINNPKKVEIKLNKLAEQSAEADPSLL